MAKEHNYQERFYREWTDAGDLVAQEVVIGETDLFIYAQKDIRGVAEKIVKKYRSELEDYIKKHPDFKTSLKPLKEDSQAPLIIKEMLRASILAGVGPMAAVAGAIAEFVGKELLVHTEELIIENGGDIFIKSSVERRVKVFAGSSPLSGKLIIKVRPLDTPLGVCTSSGTVGHSLSFGKADGCVIIAKSAALADSVATATCNRVREKEDIRHSLKFALSISGVEGALIVLGGEFGVIGDMELL